MQYKDGSQNNEILRVLAPIISEKKEIVVNNKTYKLSIDNFESCYEHLTLTFEDGQKVPIYLCIDGTDTIGISGDFLNENMSPEGWCLVDANYAYTLGVNCPQNDEESMVFIEKLFETFLPDILNNRHMEPVFVTEGYNMVLPV